MSENKEPLNSTLEITLDPLYLYLPQIIIIITIIANGQSFTWSVSWAE